MSFLYKHYEKIVLAFFLLIFAAALVYLIMVFSQAKETTEEDLRIRPEGQNYVSLFDENGVEIKNSEEKGNFSVLANLKDGEEWVSSKQRDPNSIDTTDLLIPFKAARCDKCHRLIPCLAFESKICPLCHKNPGKVKKIKVEVVYDADKDGIPDALEKELGLDSTNPDDALLDLDNDGYSNLVEYKAKTALNDPKSHPPLAEKLKLLGLARKKLPLVLVDVKERGKDKKNWVVEVKMLNRRGKLMTAFKKIGDTLKLDQQGRYMYTITNGAHKMGEKFDKKLNRPVPVPASEITIVNAMDKSDKPIIVTVGKAPYENKIKLGLQDTVTGKKYILKNGAKFIVGDANTGTEEYTVIGVSDISKVPKSQSWADIQRADGKKFRINLTSQIDAHHQDGANSGVMNQHTQKGSESDRRTPKESKPRSSAPEKSRNINPDDFDL